MEKREVQYLLQSKAEIKLMKRSLISLFVLKNKPFTIKDLILVRPKLQRKDTILYKVSKSMISRWLEENRPQQVWKAATKMDLAKTASRQYFANY